MASLVTKVASAIAEVTGCVDFVGLPCDSKGVYSNDPRGFSIFAFSTGYLNDIKVPGSTRM